MPDKLEPRDYRFILLCLVLCAASVIFGIRYFYRAFPEASIQFQVTRDSSLPVAEKFLTTQGVSTVGYRHASVFRYDDEAKVFMEREVGLEKANALLSRDLRLWRWGHRWFKPLQKEEVRVEVTTRGDIASFFHSLPEESPGADLGPEAARSIAESFLVLEMGRHIDSLEFLDSQVQKRPHRTDHVFTWKALGMDYHGATYRASVTVQGDKVDGYSEFLKIPEEWTRSYTRLRSLNESTTQVDLLFFVLLGVAMLAILARRVRMKDVRWKTALGYGAISFVLQFLATLNSFPLSEYGFDTTSSYGSFVGRTFLSALLTGLTLGGIILLLTACSEPLYRQSFPRHLSITRLFSWNGIRTRRFFIACLAGITLTFFFTTYDIGFYLLANRLGAWAPAEVPYTDLLNTRFPWVFVLFAGFFPAVSEEWMFRVFSIPYLQSLFRYRWLAVFLASFIWGFGHANYPNQPFFIRGIEVGIAGLIFSWAMLRFGILAPLIAHYSIDAFYSAFLFLRSGNAYLVTTGAITAGINLIPLLVAAGAYVATREFKSESEVVNEKEGTAPVLPEEISRVVPATLPAYTHLSSRSSYAGMALLLLGAVIVVFHPPRFGDFVEFRLSAPQAEKVAEEFLTHLGFDLRPYRRATQPLNRSDSMAAQYVYTMGGISKLNQLYRDLTPVAAWQTRFYKALEKEEFRVDVDPASGKVVSFRHALAEETPGADLDQERARSIVVPFLLSRGYDLAQFELKEAKSEKPKQRRDTEFTWEARDGTPGAVGQARLRLRAALLGDKIGSWTQYVKIPEDWRRSREKQNAYSITLRAVQWAFMVAIFVLATATLVRATRQGIVRWRVVVKVAALAMLAELLNLLNSAPKLFFQYDTQIEMRIYVLTGIVGGIILLVGIGLSVGLAVGVILACYPESPSVLKRDSLILLGRDAGIASLATLGSSLLLQGAASQIQYRASNLALAPSFVIPSNLGAYLPLISNLRDVLLGVLFYSAVLALGTYAWKKYAGKPWIRTLIILGLIGTLLPTSARRLPEVVLDFLPSLLLLALACWIVTSFFRNNYLAYIVSLAMLSMARKALAFQGQGNVSLELQGWLFAGLMAAGILYLFTRKQKAAH